MCFPLQRTRERKERDGERKRDRPQPAFSPFLSFLSLLLLSIFFVSIALAQKGSQMPHPPATIKDAWLEKARHQSTRRTGPIASINRLSWLASWRRFRAHSLPHVAPGHAPSSLLLPLPSFAREKREEEESSCWSVPASSCPAACRPPPCLTCSSFGNGSASPRATARPSLRRTPGAACGAATGREPSSGAKRERRGGEKGVKDLR